MTAVATILLNDRDRQRAEAAAKAKGYAPSLVDDLLSLHVTRRDDEGNATFVFITDGVKRELPVGDAVAEFIDRNRGHLAEHLPARTRREPPPVGRVMVGDDDHSRVLGVLDGTAAPWKPDAEPVDALTEELARAFGPDLRRVV